MSTSYNKTKILMHRKRCSKTYKTATNFAMFSYLLLLSVSMQVYSQSVKDSKFSGTVTYTTDYIWHGYSKSDGKDVFQANLDYQHSSGLFGGIWISQIDFADGQFFKNPSQVEFIPYFGSTYTLSEDWHGDIHWRRYIYEGNFFGESGDYNEFTASISYHDMLTASIGLTDDGYGSGGVYPDYELAGQFPINDLFDFSANIGYVHSREALNFDYLFWDAGLTFSYKFIALDFRYFNSSRFNRKIEDQEGFAAIKPTFVFKASLGF